MKKRKNRLPIIIDLLTNKTIGSQEELLTELATLGFKITQATLSRDLKELKTSKIADGIGGYRYVVSNSHEPYETQRYCNVPLPLRPIIYSISRSGNILVIKSPASQAKLMSNAFDAVKTPGMIAAISVSDILLIVLEPEIDSLTINSMLCTVIARDIVDEHHI